MLSGAESAFFCLNVPQLFRKKSLMDQKDEEAAAAPVCPLTITSEECNSAERCGGTHCFLLLNTVLSSPIVQYHHFYFCLCKTLILFGLRDVVSVAFLQAYIKSIEINAKAKKM